MGFMDKAKQVADQAQRKLEETQKHLHDSKAGPAANAPSGQRFDEHGRPVSRPDAETAQGVAQPRPQEAVEPIDAQPTVDDPKPSKPGMNTNPDPFKPIQ